MSTAGKQSNFFTMLILKFFRWSFILQITTFLTPLKITEPPSWSFCLNSFISDYSRISHLSTCETKQSKIMFPPSISLPPSFLPPLPFQEHSKPKDHQLRSITVSITFQPDTKVSKFWYVWNQLSLSKHFSLTRH